MISPYSLRPLSGILAHFNLSNWRAIALLKAFGFLRFEARFEFPVYSRASAGCWGASILSYQHCGNRLPSSTGGAEVTGGALEASEARGFEHRGYS